MCILYIFIIVIGQVTGVILTCELLSLFDHYCTVIWNVIQVCIYAHTYTHTIYYIYAVMKISV